jgi:hypothetical protein
MDVIVRLRAHGVQVNELSAERAIQLERFRIDSTTAGANPFEGRNERTVYGAWEAASAVTVPAGTYVVPMDQPLARLIFLLLEPRSDDGFTDWAILDRAIEGATHHPVLRSHAPLR